MKKKGSSQRGLGSYVPALLNDSPFFEDIIPQEPDSVKREFFDGIKKQAKKNSNILSDDGYSEYNLPITFDDVKKIHEIFKQNGEISVKRFNSEQLKLTQKWAYKFYNDIGIKSPFFTA